MYLLCKRVIKLIPGPECLPWPSISSNIVNPLVLLNPPSLLPRQQFDHGIMVFDCQPCLTMFGDGVTVACDHGLLSLKICFIFPLRKFVTKSTSWPFFRKRCVLKVSQAITPAKFFISKFNEGHFQYLCTVLKLMSFTFWSRQLHLHHHHQL